jgi:Matrixin
MAKWNKHQVLQSVIYFLLLIILLTNCQCAALRNIKHEIAGPDHLHKTLYIATDFTPEEMQQIKEAAQEWEEKTHHFVIFDEVYYEPKEITPNISSGNNNVVMVNCFLGMQCIQEMDEAVKKEHPNASTLYGIGLYVPKSPNPMIYIASDRISTWHEYKTATLHELGHSLGLDHDEKDNQAIMYYAPSAQHLTDEDIREFCKLHGCEFPLK